ncbi:MAG TPA: hypothetical protein VGD79_09985, partial [Thermoanaerobaculia bacterium]
MIVKLIRILRHPDFPYRAGHKPMPFELHAMFWVGFSMPFGTILFVAWKLLAGQSVDLTLYDQEVFLDDLFMGAGSVSLLLVAVTGI